MAPARASEKAISQVDLGRDAPHDNDGLSAPEHNHRYEGIDQRGDDHAQYLTSSETGEAADGDGGEHQSPGGDDALYAAQTTASFPHQLTSILSCCALYEQKRLSLCKTVGQTLALANLEPCG